MVRRETRRRGVRLEVTAAYPDDEGTQRVRVDPASLLHLGASPGDTVEIQGVSLTFGVVEKTRMDHYNLGNVYLPERLRENASVSVGEMVTVEPAVLEPATAARLTTSAPRESLPFDDVARRLDFLDRLQGRPVCLGDSLGIVPDGADRAVELRVEAVRPDDSVLLAPETDYEIEVRGAERSQRRAEVDLD